MELNHEEAQSIQLTVDENSVHCVHRAEGWFKVKIKIKVILTNCC